MNENKRFRIGIENLANLENLSRSLVYLLNEHLQVTFLVGMVNFRVLGIFASTQLEMNTCQRAPI